MERGPLVGYNHNFRYRNRVFHVQTEDSGGAHAHVYTHLFFEGMVVSSVRTDYHDLLPRPELRQELTHLMREQHKGMMRQVKGGQLDKRIVEILGCLDPTGAARPGKIKCYRHQLLHEGRQYQVQTEYYATVLTDLFVGAVLVDSVRQRCTAPPGSPAVEKVAQTQHKQMMKRLRSGGFDQRIVQLLGRLSPLAERPAATRTWQPIREHYAHRIRHDDRIYEVRTTLPRADRPQIVTEVLQEETRVEHRVTEYPEPVDDAAGAQALRKRAQQQHKAVLKQLRQGAFDPPKRLGRLALVSRGMSRRRVR